ncbi:hypothetical protein ScPMuIL_014402 [Solemya velum]
MKLLFIAFLFLAYTNINVVKGKCKGWKLRMLEWIGCDGPDDTKPLCKVFGFCEDKTVECGTRVLEGGLAASDCTTKDCVATLSCDADKNLVGPSSSTCQEDGSWTNETGCFYMTECHDQEDYELPDGVYLIDSKAGLLDLYCDRGLTVIQRRTSGTLNFNRTWDEYKNGFGDLAGDFWLGNENIHSLTEDSALGLQIDLLVEDGTEHLISYFIFAVDTETNKYMLTLLFYRPTTQDDFSDQNGSQFSTYDSDNDGVSADCAAIGGGGWWYNTDCNPVDFNGSPYQAGSNGLT